MSERYDSEMYRLGEENLRLSRELRQERAEHHTFRIGVEKDRFLKANESDCDTVNLGEYISASNPRVIDGRVVIDFGDDKTLTGTLDEAGEHWRAHPDKWGNLVGITKKKEPTPQEKRNAEIGSMPMDQYLKQRKRPGFFDPQ